MTNVVVDKAIVSRLTDLEAHFQGILQRLRNPNGTTPRLVGVISCRSGEGASTVAAGLARAAISGIHTRVLLVDANLNAPVQHRLFGLQGRVGLSDVLQNAAPWKGVAQASEFRGLSLLAAGADTGSAAVKFHPARFRRLLDEIRHSFPLVILDLPAVETGGAAVSLAAQLECVLLVVEAENSRREVIRHHCETLSRAGATPIGTVLNKRQNPIPEWIYQKL